MQRDKNLQVLSHEHHQGLIFCLRLKKGSNKSIHVDIMRSYVIDFWDHHLQQHFEDEEEILGPYLASNHHLTQQFHQEHKNIRALIANIKEKAEPKLNSFTALSLAVEEHIRFEERKLFPHLENMLSNEQLEKIGSSFDHEAACHYFNPEFWKSR